MILSSSARVVPAQPGFFFRGEEAADLSAFQREYEDDHSWEQLQEDEHGHLRAIVCQVPLWEAACKCS